MNVTGKGWTDEEEAAFAQIMEAGDLERLPAIRLYRRLGGNLKRALKYAAEAGERKVSAAKRFKRRLQGQNRSQTNAASPRAAIPVLPEVTL